MRTLRYSVPRSFWYYLVIAASVFLCAFCWYLFRPGTSMVYRLGQFFFHLLCLVLCISFALLSFRWRRRRTGTSGETARRSRQDSIPLFIALAAFLWLLSDLGYLYIYIMNIQWFPSWADFLELATYPPLLIPVFLLPTHSLSVARRLRIAVDSWMALTACITFTWYFVLGPIVLQADVPWFQKLVAAGFPGLNLLLLCCIIITTYRGVSPALKPAVTFLVVGLLAGGMSNTLYDYELIQQTYKGGWLNLGWLAAFLLTGLGCQALRWQVIQDAQVERLPVATKSEANFWQMLLPYIFVPFVILLVIYVAQQKVAGSLTQVVYAGAVFLFFLVFMRQILSMYDIQHLNKALQTSNTQIGQARQSLQEKNIALAQANQRLEELATRDSLTELPNHRTLMTLIEQELERARQYKRPCSLLFLDIDHFKALNDGYGHPAGDTILYECSHLVRDLIRPIDTIGRWGGEEFVAILPELGQQESLHIAELIRSSVAEHNFTVGGGIYLTCSIGVSCFPLHSEQRESLLQAADQAMYGAKRLGRNQVRTPYDPAVLALLAESMSEKGREDTAIQGIVLALFKLIEATDTTLAQHCQQVSTLLFTIAQSLDISNEEAQMLALAGQLHDLGKVAFPDRLLKKMPPFTAEERLLLSNHPILGAEVVSHIPSLRPLAPVIRAHHERWDGQGYPDQLVKEAIPFGARLLNIVDSYIVMTTGRTYQKACSPEDAVKRLQDSAGGQFDPQLVETFIRHIQPTLQHVSSKTLSM